MDMPQLDQTKLNETKDTIKKDIESNRIVLFMKGTKMAPQCGFSGQVNHMLSMVGEPYETRNVLEDPYLRQAIKDYSDWPTIPQLYVDGEFLGGCDIITEMFQNGELQSALKPE
ncbi:MAG: Grx4 family monothiol glutaredoxin [bacterium]|nr:Grx4 family monothiol glutaredoxin [bacterium]